MRQVTIGNATLYLADSAEVLPSLSGIDACVTDPPYGLGFMGNAWDSEVAQRSLWTLTLATMKPGAHLLSFSAARTYHRAAVEIEDGGFEIRDQIMWLYGTGWPKSGQLKPAHEPIVMARRPFRGSEAKNVANHGTGKIEIEACRVPHNENLAVEREARAFDTKGKGWGFKAMSRGNQGRHPANVVHDGSEVVLGQFPETRSGSASRYFYCAKASGKELEGNDHPTVKPIGLMAYLCRLVTPRGGVVLDPFMGSGSTGVAALQEGFRFVGMERVPAYFEIACARIAHAQGLPMPAEVREFVASEAVKAAA